MKKLSGGYKGKHFDPTKSKQYNALMTYFQFGLENTDPRSKLLNEICL